MSGHIPDKVDIQWGMWKFTCKVASPLLHFRALTPVSSRVAVSPNFVWSTPQISVLFPLSRSHDWIHSSSLMTVRLQWLYGPGPIALSHWYKYCYKQLGWNHQCILSLAKYQRKTASKIMHFISLCSLVLLATMTNLVGAYKPMGEPCNSPGAFNREYELHIPTDLISNRRLWVRARWPREWRTRIPLPVRSQRQICVFRRM